MIPYPFSAIVGQDDLRLALVINAVSPAVGGVLIRGEKGTAKSTAVRGLVRVMPDIDVVEGCRFNCDPDAADPDCPDEPHRTDAKRVRRPVSLVELPVGASTDRVAGSLDVERALVRGERAFEPGLLAAAHRGVLYVDEVNLLGDHLVDLLLDAAALGVNYVERDGVSIRHSSRFLIVGTMNPEEGELRPQLLDRFGISVDVAGNADAAERAEVVRRRLAFERDSEAFVASFRDADASLGRRIAEGRDRLPEVQLPDEMLDRIVSVCAAFEVDGLRADIVSAKTAVALAACDGRTEVDLDDVRRAALLALPHRRRRGPFEKAGIDPGELDHALGGDRPEPRPPEPRPPEPRGGGTPPPRPGPGGTDDEADEKDPIDNGSQEQVRPPAAGAPARAQVLPAGTLFVPRLIEATGLGAGALGRRSRAEGAHGHPVGERATNEHGASVSVPGTLRAAAPHQLARGRRGAGLILRRNDLRFTLHEGREGNLVLFVVDASGSMAARRRMTATKGAVLSLLLDTYQRHDRVGLVTFRGNGAQVVLPPTSSVERAAARLRELPTGGRTPLAAGLARAAEVLALEAVRDPKRRPLLVLVTDGRANVGRPDPLEAARRAAARIVARCIPAVVVDSEDGGVRLGLAADIAAALHATTLSLDELPAAPLAATVGRATGRIA